MRAARRARRRQPPATAPGEIERQRHGSNAAENHENDNDEND